MPIYNYQCQECGAQQEVWAKFDDPPPLCDACGKDALSRQVARTGFALKGGGWYAQGYGSSGSSSSSGGSGASGGGSD
ncbi:MAG: zinc ribbon domain-containing protein [Myxococcales bacterium]|nr:zinc ribbon domain-containing protein [Myxococcales bacterium]MCB9526621.1 zinc ribbon domain-containing protein [Myxococcales bacterium]